MQKIVTLFWVLLFTFLPQNNERKIQFKNVSKDKLPVLDLISNTMDVEIADLDADGFLDIVIAVEFGADKILWNDGKGGFKDIQLLSTEINDSEDIALADFDGDGIVDIFIACEDTRKNAMYLNNGKRFFKNVSDRLPEKGISNACLALDIDMDGDQDILVGNQGQNFLWLNDGKGNFSDKSDILPKIDHGTTQDMEAADLNGDGLVDLVIANENGNQIWMNKRNLKFEYVKEALPLPNYKEETREIDVADIDRDGDLDLFLANVKFTVGEQSYNRVLLNNGDGIFEDATSTWLIQNKEYHSVDVDFIDFNTDGKIDVVISSAFGDPCQILINNGNSFIDKTPEYLDSVYSNSVDVEVADLNKDGVPDIYFSGFQTADILLFGEKL